MTINEGLRLAAGFFTILSVVLGVYVSEYWFLFTIFVGLNQIQSAFTHWCPMMWMHGRIFLSNSEKSTKPQELEPGVSLYARTRGALSDSVTS